MSRKCSFGAACAAALVLAPASAHAGVRPNSEYQGKFSDDHKVSIDITINEDATQAHIFIQVA